MSEDLRVIGPRPAVHRGARLRLYKICYHLIANNLLQIKHKNYHRHYHKYHYYHYYYYYYYYYYTSPGTPSRSRRPPRQKARPTAAYGWGVNACGKGGEALYIKGLPFMHTYTYIYIYIYIYIYGLNYIVKDFILYMCIYIYIYIYMYKGKRLRKLQRRRNCLFQNSCYNHQIVVQLALW